LASVSDRVIWGVPLYAPDAPLHDQIVGKAGAFEQLSKSMALLAKSGAQIELRTVIMSENVAWLPALAMHVTTRLPFVSTWALMQLENIGFGRKNWAQLFHDSGADFSAIGAALDIAAARNLDALLFNFPLCTVPPAYRRYAVATVSDWKRKYVHTCDGCAQRMACGGFFEWYPEGRGFSKLGLQ
jgi:His-Xaa-Ser system radical SAM maturase HxsC